MINNNYPAQALIILFSLIFLNPVTAQRRQADDVEQFTRQVFHLSEIMLHDVASPPAASRFYAYSLLGAYQAITDVRDTGSLTHRFSSSLAVESPARPAGFHKAFCAAYTMLEVGKHIMPSGGGLEEAQHKLVAHYKKRDRLTEKIMEVNKAYAEAVAAQIMRYARTDGYGKLSANTRYTPGKEEGCWYPTPPEYMPPVEPYWNTVRPFFIRSADQFAPSPPAEFSTDPASGFYRLMKEVYDVTRDLTSEQRQMAAFWDCNPFAVTYSGHMAVGLKKISPGGHWMAITGIVCNQHKVSFDSAVLAHTLVALTLHDAFISCWDEKFRSDRIRPVSAIHKYIDPAWSPLLQTPPFPEYTSGHSVISTASAEILTYLFGEVKFTDTSEEYFGLPPRTFSSFRQAANEAALSRLYGGIHYRDAIEEGQKQGKALGSFVIGLLSETPQVQHAH